MLVFLFVCWFCKLFKCWSNCLLLFVYWSILCIVIIMLLCFIWCESVLYFLVIVVFFFRGFMWFFKLYKMFFIFVKLFFVWLSLFNDLVLCFLYLSILVDFLIIWCLLIGLVFSILLILFCEIMLYVFFFNLEFKNKLVIFFNFVWLLFM